MYGKIFASMFRGSLYGQWEALVTFTVMIVLADKEGEVDMTPEALSAQTSIPLEIIRKGIASLEAPDTKSRTPDGEGRRIVRVSDSRDWGWTITNYAHYRAMRTADERREYFKQHKRKQRAKKSTSVNSVNHGPPAVHKSPQSPPIAVSSKQYAEGEGKAGTTTTAVRVSWLTPIAAVYEQRMGAGSFPFSKAGKLLKPLIDAGHSSEEVATRLGRYLDGLDDAKFLNLAKFRETFGKYATDRVPNGKVNPGLQQMANILGREHD